jgi:hypothetical protein
VRTIHSGHHVGLERQLALLAGLQGRRTDDRLEWSTPSHDAHVDIFDLQRVRADVRVGEGVPHLRVERDDPEIDGGGREVQVGAAGAGRRRVGIGACVTGPRARQRAASEEVTASMKPSARRSAAIRSGWSGSSLL